MILFTDTEPKRNDLSRQESPDRTAPSIQGEQSGFIYRSEYSPHESVKRSGQADVVEYMLDFIRDVHHLEPAEAEQERLRLEARISEGNFKELMAMLNAQGGVEGAGNLHAALVDYNNKLQFSLDELNTNPTRYLARKRAEIQQALASGTHLGQMFAGMPDTDVVAMQVENELVRTMGSIFAQQALVRQQEGQYAADGLGYLGAMIDVLETLQNSRVVKVGNESLDVLRSQIEAQIYVLSGGRQGHQQAAGMGGSTVVEQDHHARQFNQ